MIKTTREAENYVQTICNLSFKGQGSVDWTLMSYFVYHIHTNDCEKAECTCKKIKQIQQKHSKSKDQREEERKELGQLWLKLYEGILEQEVERWPNSRPLLLQISYYESIMLKNYFKSYYWLLKAEEMRAPQNERYLTFRMKHILSNCIIMKESKALGPSHVKNALRFHKVCTKFQDMLYFSTNLIKSLWSLLEMVKLNVNELYRKGEKITLALRFLNDLFKKAVEINHENPYNYIYYGQFLHIVLNSEDEGREWMNRGVDIIKQQNESRTKYSEDISKSADAAVIVVSGNLSKIGMVVTANENVHEQLGFEVSDLVGRNISRIMPRIIGELHDTFMINHFKLGVGTFLGEESMVFIQTKTGLMEPICVLIKTLPGLERNLQYIGFLKRDFATIRNNFIKLPSKYKGKKVAYIFADNDKFVIGFSKNACTIFGLHESYIKRKKGLTTSPYLVTKLAPELGYAENERALENGMELILHTKSVLDYLDFDHLNSSEESMVRKASETPHRAFVMQYKFNYQQLVTLRMYAIVDLGQTNEQKVKGMDTKNNFLSFSSELGVSDDEFRGEIAKKIMEGRMDSIVSQSTTSSSQKNSVSKGNIGDIKKQATIRDRPASVKRLVWIILLFGTVLISNVIIEFSFFYTYLNNINDLNNVIVLSFRRLNHFNIAIYKIMAYLNIANGLEPEMQDFIGNKTKILYIGTDAYLIQAEQDEYNLENAILSSPVSDLSSSTIFQSFQVNVITATFVQYNVTSSLNAVIIEILNMGGDIVYSTKSQLASVHYLNNFVSTGTGDTLSMAELSFYYIFANSFNGVQKLLSSSWQLIYSSVIDNIDSYALIMLAICLLMYTVITFFAFFFIPFLLKIQTNKRNLLMIFAEIPLLSITSMLKNCQGFLKSKLGHMSLEDEPDQNSDNAQKAKKNQSDEEARDNDNETDKKLSAEDLNKEAEDVKGHLQSKENPSDQNEKNRSEEKDETQEKLLAKAQNEKAENFAKERKKAVERVSLSWGNHRL